MAGNFGVDDSLVQNLPLPVAKLDILRLQQQEPARSASDGLLRLGGHAEVDRLRGSGHIRRPVRT